MSVLPKSDSLRARKKARTRSEIIATASRLFRKQGYEATTLEQIAEEAEVSIRTLLRYFGSKPQLALARFHDRLDVFTRRIADPSRKEDTLACWREHVQEAAREFTERRSDSIGMEQIYRVPALAVGFLEIAQRFEDAIARGLAADAGSKDPGEDLYADLLAAMLVAVNGAVLRRCAAHVDAEDLARTCLAVVDFALEHFPARATGRARRLRSVSKNLRGR